MKKIMLTISLIINLISSAANAAVINNVPKDQIDHFEIESTSKYYFCGTIARLKADEKTIVAEEWLDNFSLPNGDTNYGPKDPIKMNFSDEHRKTANYAIVSIMCTKERTVPDWKSFTAPYQSEILFSAALKDGSRHTVTSGIMNNFNGGIEVHHLIRFK